MAPSGFHRMNLTLSPRLEGLVRRKAESGPYRTAGDVDEEAHRLLNEQGRDDPDQRAASPAANVASG